MGRWNIDRIPCSHCHGTRKINGQPCPYCGGKGFLSKKKAPPKKVAKEKRASAVHEQAPANAMGGSSSVSGTGNIATTDPIMKKKIKRKPIGEQMAVPGKLENEQGSSPTDPLIKKKNLNRTRVPTSKLGGSGGDD